MVTICSFSISDWNKPLIMAHFCSNDSISRTESITVVNAHDLAHSDSWAIFPSVWNQKYYFTDVSSFKDFVGIEGLH